MSLPFIRHITPKIFLHPPYLLIVPAFALEGLRRTWLSGTSLGLFIDLGLSTPHSCIRDCANLRRYLDVDRTIIEAIPKIAWPLIGPWIDHHNAQECFYEIAVELCNARNYPIMDWKSCCEAWEHQAEE